MRFTHKPAPDLGVSTHDTLQVFSAKVASTSGGLQWPLDVFGFVAIRDTIDHNRNIIFNRTRESCQILTEEVWDISYSFIHWFVFSLIVLPTQLLLYIVPLPFPCTCAPLPVFVIMYVGMCRVNCYAC
jgi:hypothetical protein